MIDFIINEYRTLMRFDDKDIEGFSAIKLDKAITYLGKNIQIKDFYGLSDNKVCDYLRFENNSNELVFTEKTQFPSYILMDSNPIGNEDYVTEMVDESLSKFNGSITIASKLGRSLGYVIDDKIKYKFILVIQGFGADMSKHKNMIEELDYKVNDKFKGLYTSTQKVTIAEDMLENHKEYLTEAGFKEKA